ncbi:cytochrome P450 [Mycobacterium szulgai]|uniref:cytochrome P450 n=1 Tax=Mycobacterium szulgai TaxID=1787 RepID=UPI0021F2A97D|nr:cytochrome P450 [Mycobacterium szulgai]MCV7079461.1 cytochrome P450 [Mycobacterium szulgai]
MNDLQSIPSAPGALPLFGHALSAMRDPWRFLSGLPDHGDLVRVRLGPSEAVVVCTPELTHQVMVDDRTFDKVGPLYARSREILGTTVVSASHDQHRPLRRKAQPSFHRNQMPGYARVMTDRIDAFTASWQDNEVLDVWPEMRGLSAAIGVDALFGNSISPDDIDRFIDATSTVNEGVYGQSMLPAAWRKLPTPANRRYRNALAEIHRIARNMGAACRAEDRTGFLSMLLDGDKSPAEIGNEIITYLVAAYDTGASTLAWALHLLAEHPEIEERLHAEVDAVLAGQPASFDHLPHLELTERVIMETLRIQPVSWIFTRCVTTETELGGYQLPAGTAVALSPWIIHHRPDVYPDPARFDPDRWLPDRKRSAKDGTMIAFGSGSRRCIGELFGKIESILALATIVSRWQLRTLAGSSVRPTMATVNHPKGLHMRVTARLNVSVAVPVPSAGTPSGEPTH